ncbi:hypothetical protein RND71_010478 [Anisodus tanguticus]|uniref:Potassium transporter n=1 Tax=Anisodus tanguticus TaxID=243964 RepID=A0AAE1VI66_9SOLA|nr:hypothetical protein RND71_010478 [Anisodus tanguticus]
MNNEQVLWYIDLIENIGYKSDDNGEGGTFALYSLLCRHAKLNPLPSFQLAEEQLSTYKKDINTPAPSTFGAKLKSNLEKYRVLQRFLLLLALIGACMVIGDGILTPAISDVEVPVACIVLIALFALQHYGTHRVGFLFAPVVVAWLLCISAIGVYNIIHWNPHVYRALSPYYMYKFLKKTQTRGWMSLGGILFIIISLNTKLIRSGSEAMFADLGHFSQLSIKSVLLAICFVIFFGSIEALYFSASLIKFLEGAWVPIAMAFVFMIVMCIWHYGSLKKYEFDVQNKVSADWLLHLGPSLGIVRVRGIGVIHTELVSGIPTIFSHFVTNLPAFHQVLVFVCVKVVPTPHIRHEERFLVGYIGPRECHVYRCIVRYGYRDAHKDDSQFEDDLVCSIAEFIRTGNKDLEDMTVVGTPSTQVFGVQLREDGEVKCDTVGTSELREIHPSQITKPKKRVKFVIPETPKIDRGAQEELRELMEAREAGIAYILGHYYVEAKQGSSLFKKVVINYGYEFLRRNSRTITYALTVPHASTLEVMDFN